MSTKKSHLFIIAFAICTTFLLLPDYSNAQNLPPMPKPIVVEEGTPDSVVDDLVKQGAEIMTPRGRCKKFYNREVDKYKYIIKIDTESRCLVEALYRQDLKGGYVLTEVLDHYITPDGKKFCIEYRNEHGKITLGPKCWDYKAKTIPSSGGFSEKADLPEPIIIKKGEYYENDFSKELINLLDPQDRSGPYTFSLNTMGGFPPMGLMLGLDGVLKGTPVGKDDYFEACVKNGSGRSVCKVINIKLEKDKSDKPELGIIDSIKSAFEPAKSTKINYQDLVYGEKGQIKSKIHERIAILMKDGSIVEMDQYSTLTPNSEYELTTDIGKFKFNYEKFLGPNSFCAFGALLSESCRQVNTPNGTIRIKGTEFTVENDSSGTSIAVIEGTVLVSDIKSKKELEINKGQFVFLKDGKLLEYPQPFEPSQLDRWWEKESTEQSDEEKDGITLVVLGIVTLVFLIVAIIKKLFRKKTMTEEEKRGDAKVHKIQAAFSLIIGVGTIFFMLIFYLSPTSLPQSVLNAIVSLVFPCIGLAGLMMGLLEAKLSEKILSAFMILLNIISVILWIVFVMPHY